VVVVFSIPPRPCASCPKRGANIITYNTQNHCESNKKASKNNFSEASIFSVQWNYFNFSFSKSVVVDPGRSIGIPIARSQIKFDNVPSERATPNKTV